MSEAAIIALDWGTTNVRAALLGADGSVLEERKGESGVGKLDHDGFADRFDRLTDGWPSVPAITCGMIGSRQGWHEADYLPCPTGIDNLAGAIARFNHAEQIVAIVPGLMMDDTFHHDVMRGEETQIAGWLARQPEFSGTLVLPGTHSKWVWLEKGIIRKFHTYMTGEIFSALAGHTILRHSVSVDGNDTIDAERRLNTFKVAVGDIFMTKGSDMRRFFELRANMLLMDVENGLSREQLSGFLVGMELASAIQDGFDAQDIVLIGDEELTTRYEAATEVLAATAQKASGRELVFPALFDLAGKAGLIGGQ